MICTARPSFRPNHDLRQGSRTAIRYHAPGSPLRPAMASCYLLLSSHIPGACIWAGSHPALAITVLPRALRARRATIIADCAPGYERLKGRPLSTS